MKACRALPFEGCNRNVVPHAKLRWRRESELTSVRKGAPAQLRVDFLVGIIERFNRLTAYRMQPFAYEMPTAW